jgi:hypothetical protein
MRAAHAADGSHAAGGSHDRAVAVEVAAYAINARRKVKAPLDAGLSSIRFEFSITSW